MKVEVQMPVAELKQVLLGLGKVVQKKSTLPVLGCLRVMADKGGDVCVQATNLDDFATAKMDRAAAECAGEVLVSYDELNGIVKGCSKDQSIHIIGSDKETSLRYPIGNSHVTRKLEFMDVKEWPSVPKVEGDSVSVSTELKEAISEAFDHSSTDETRYVLQSAYLDVSDPKSHYVVATSGRVLFSANSFQLGLKESVIVPNRKFLQWSGFIEDESCVLSVGTKKKDASWLSFTSKGWDFITKRIEGDYPRWRQVIPTEFKTELTFSDEAVQFLLSAIPKLPGKDGRNEPVQIVTEKDSVLIQGRQNATDPVTSLPVVGVTLKGEPTTFTLNRSFMSQALKLGLKQCGIVDDLTPVVFKDNHKRLVIATLRNEIPATGSPAPAPIQQENTNPPQPSEERKEMPKAQTPAPQSQTQPSKTPTAFDQVQEHIETIKTALKDIVGDLNDLLKVVTQAVKEKKATEKEIESIRESLQQIQRMKI